LQTIHWIDGGRLQLSRYVRFSSWQVGFRRVKNFLAQDQLY
jgi:hypothetical protein